MAHQLVAAQQQQGQQQDGEAAAAAAAAAAIPAAAQLARGVKVQAMEQVGGGCGCSSGAKWQLRGSRQGRAAAGSPAPPPEQQEDLGSFDAVVLADAMPLLQGGTLWDVLLQLLHAQPNPAVACGMCSAVSLTKVPPQPLSSWQEPTNIPPCMPKPIQ